MRRAGSECAAARLLRLLWLATALLCGMGAARAQGYPDKPVHIVVPFPAGGGVDVLIRAVAAQLSERWHQPVIIDNRAGAGSLIGAEAAARAAPDGYTLMATINQTLTSNRFLYKKLPYDPDRSFAPVALMTTSDQFLLATPSLAAKNLAEMLALARRAPGTVAYGSFGNGSQPHLLYGLLAQRAGVELTHVPYKGVAPALSDLLGGQIQLSTGSASVAGELIKAGKLRPLAVASGRRSTLFPDVPTTQELGYPELRAAVWYALLAPAGTPEPVVRRIAEDVRAVLTAPDFQQRNATARGLEVNAGGPEELRQAIRDDLAATRQLIEAAGIRPE